MTNRDHSPSISQNDARDAKSSGGGSGLDLDALEKVALEASPGPWEADQSGFDFTWSVAANGWPVAHVSAEDRNGVTEDADAHYISTFDPPTCLSLIQTQRELVAALKEIAAGGFNCSTHQWFMVAQALAESALAKAPPPSARPGEGGSTETLEARQTLPSGDQ